MVVVVVVVVVVAVLMVARVVVEVVVAKVVVAAVAVRMVVVVAVVAVAVLFVVASTRSFLATAFVARGEANNNKEFLYFNELTCLSTIFREASKTIVWWR